jgi:hypothetical protein
MKRLACSLTLLVCAMSLAAAEDAPPAAPPPSPGATPQPAGPAQPPTKEKNSEAPPVQVGDFAIVPMGNLSSAHDAVTLHPKILGSINYNTNINSTEHNTKHDTYYALNAGLDLNWHLNKKDSLTISGEFIYQYYSKYHDHDLIGGRGNASWTHSASGWGTTVEADGARTNDPNVNTGQQIKHDDGHASVSGHTDSKFEHLSGGLDLNRTRYLEDATAFLKDDRNSTTYAGNARAGKEVGDDSEMFLRGALDRHVYDSSSNTAGTFSSPGSNNSTGYQGYVGVKDKLGSRSGVMVEVGAAYRVYSDNYHHLPVYDDKRVLEPAGNVLARWSWEEGSWLNLRAYSRVDDSLTANAAWMYGGVLDGRYRLKKQASLFASGTFYELRSSGANTGSPIEVRDTYETNFGVEYILRQGLGVKLENTITLSLDNLPNSDFHRDVASLELGFVY